ncbi:hypothetical protein [Streptomyces cyaneofuscatus]
MVSVIVRLLADGPGTGIPHSLVTRMCTTLALCGATLGYRGR